MRSEERLARERREPFDRGTMQAKEGLQVLQEMNREEERPKESQVLHTAATRGVLEYIFKIILYTLLYIKNTSCFLIAYAPRGEEKLDGEENGEETHQTEEEERGTQ